MLRFNRVFFIRLLVLEFILGCLVLSTATASAAGRVEWTKTTLKERESKSWLLDLKIFMPRPPHVAHVPMKFEFKPYTYYERAMMDGDKIVERAVPLEHQQSLVETVDVGFMEPSSGKILNRTKFSFKVTRAHGYNAGEYQVTIKDIDGNRIGATTKLIFEGENEIIDRRAMVFGGEKKRKPKKEGEDGASEEKKEESDEAKSEGEGGGEGNDDSNDDSAAGGDGESSESEGEGKGSDDEPTEGPPPIEQKPGGCGCRTDTGTSPQASLGALFLLALSLGLRRRSVRL